MSAMLPLTDDDRIYLRPTAFVESPVAFDGQVERIAGGLTFFSAYEVIAMRGHARSGRWLVPVGEIEQRLPPAHRERGGRLIAAIRQPRAPLSMGTRIIRLDQPQVMAILNLTPDSFSDGGRFVEGGRIDVDGAATCGFALAAAGAALVDVGGESTRPGASAPWEGDELARVEPVVTRLAQSGIAVSIDSRRAAVIEGALNAGAGLINDVSGLCHDPRSIEVAARGDWPVVIMHSANPAGDLHGGNDPAGDRDPLIAAYDWLEARIKVLAAAGIAPSRLLVDPGVGFGRSVKGNLALINGLSLFHGLGAPIVLGVSRKRIIGALSQEEAADNRLAGSLALAMEGARQGVQILRVHDVPETLQMLRVWRGLRDGALSEIH